MMLDLKRGEPRFVAATGVMPHGGSAAGGAERRLERPLIPLIPLISCSTPTKSTPNKVE